MTYREARYDVLFLFAGLNQDGIDDDEANGGGLNTGLDMTPFEDAKVFAPLVEPDDFWNVCPDMTIPCETRHVDVPREKTRIRVR